MTAIPHFLAHVVSDLDAAVYERRPGGGLDRVGKPPRWMEELSTSEALPADAPPAELSPYLENFLVDAEEFWRAARPGRLSSGPWCEGGLGGGEWNLEATAVHLRDGSQALIVKQLGEPFLEYRETLQRARTASLEHERLVREIEHKEVLLHCIVHDLKGPLSGIVGGLSLLKRPTLAPEKREQMIELGLGQARKLDAMIRTVLDVFSAEIEAMERFETDPASAPDMARVARAVAEQHGPAFQNKGIDLTLDAPDHPVPVAGTTERLERVLSNLLENALRYSKKGTHVRLAVTAAGAEATATLDDEGPGVADELRATLFEKFARDKRGGGAAGLGLFFCRTTVERWGGAIGHENREPNGSRFWVRLPRV